MEVFLIKKMQKDSKELFDAEAKEEISLQQWPNMRWKIVSKTREFEFHSEKELLRYLFSCQLKGEKNRPIRHSIVLKQTQARKRLDEGYKIVDNQLRVYTLCGKTILREDGEEMVNLPDFLEYMIYPWQPRINSRTTRREKIRSKKTVFQNKRIPNKPMENSEKLKALKTQMEVEEAERAKAALGKETLRQEEARKRIKWSLITGVSGVAIGIAINKLFKSDNKQRLVC